MTDIEKLEKFKNITIHYGSTFAMHIEQLKEIQEAIGNVLSDLYEANNRINDLLDLVKQKDEIIDNLVEEYEYNARINLKNFCEDETRKDKCIQDCKTCIKKYFEERCK